MNITTIDYKSWVERAQNFTQRVSQLAARFDLVEIENVVAPLLSTEELGVLLSKIDDVVPLQLQQFWLTASRHCACRYVLEGEENYSGGANFFDAVELPQHISDCRRWAEGLEFEEDAAIWNRALPFIALNNGDYIALDATLNGNDPPVVYLAHDDEPFVLAPSFTSFLQTWEKLCYIRPEIWILEPYLDDERQLTSSAQSSQQLRDVFNSDIEIASPSLSAAQIKEKRLSYIKEITTDVMMWISDYEETFPDASNWRETAFWSDAAKRTIARAIENIRLNYAMNANLSGAKLSDIRQPERTIALIETSSTFRAASVKSLQDFAENELPTLVVCADSRAHFVDEETLRSLKWTID